MYVLCVNCCFVIMFFGRVFVFSVLCYVHGYSILFQYFRLFACCSSFTTLHYCQYILILFPCDYLFFYPSYMVRNNVDFKLLSLNARGIRTFEKRKAVLNWLNKSRADICFLQKTYSTHEVEDIWRKKWKGEVFFSHSSYHRRGVLILVRDHLD